MSNQNKHSIIYKTARNTKNETKLIGHVHKYEASLWTLENWEKYLFCYKMIIFNVTVLNISENMYIINIYVPILSKIKNITPMQKKDKKVTLLQSYLLFAK